VIADGAEAIVAELNAALDRLEERYTLFGGGIETVAVGHPKTRKRSALAHTKAAGETVGRAARESLTVALRAGHLMLPSGEAKAIEYIERSEQVACLGDRSREVDNLALRGFGKGLLVPLSEDQDIHRCA
jgi:hypothetical protein